jgi:hypothetical protein
MNRKQWRRWNPYWVDPQTSASTAAELKLTFGWPFSYVQVFRCFWQIAVPFSFPQFSLTTIVPLCHSDWSSWVCNTVTELLPGQLKDYVSSPGRDNRFFYSPKHWDLLRSSHNCPFIGYVALSRGVKAAGASSWPLKLHLVRRLRMRGAMPPLSPYILWRTQGQLYFLTVRPPYSFHELL